MPLRLDDLRALAAAIANERPWTIYECDYFSPIRSRLREEAIAAHYKRLAAANDAVWEAYERQNMAVLDMEH